MALIPCPEPDCGHNISSSATVCPHCGCPVATALGTRLAASASSSDRVASPPAEIFRVALDGSGQFTSIQSALKAVKQNNTLLRIAPGTYREDLRTKFFGLKVALEAEKGPGSVTVQTDRTGIDHEAGDLEIRRLVILADSDLCIATRDQLTFRDCRLQARCAVLGRGNSRVAAHNCSVEATIALDDAASFEMINGTLRSNIHLNDKSFAIFTGSGLNCGERGIYITDRTKLKVASSSIVCEGSAGIFTSDSAKLELLDSTLQMRGGRQGVLLTQNGKSRIERCQLDLNMVDDGICIEDSHDSTISNTKVSGCDIGMRLRDEARCTLTGCDLQDNSTSLDVDEEADLRESNNRL